MPDKLFDVAYPEALRNAERCLFRKRPKWQQTDPAPQVVGVAISGGGIRSATFSLGVFQALAKLKLLGHIDYISSVSGGGYFAGLYGRIFTRDDITTVEQVEEILSPDRAGQSLDPGPHNWRDGLFRWVRENGRYLAPKGGGDLLLGLAVMLRNWVSFANRDDGVRAGDPFDWAARASHPGGATSIPIHLDFVAGHGAAVVELAISYGWSDPGSLRASLRIRLLANPSAGTRGGRRRR